MPFDKEFRHHLHELMAETTLKQLDEEDAYKRRQIYEAQQTHDGAAVAIAYSNAKIHAFCTRVEATIQRYMEALVEYGIEVDDDVEKKMLKQIGSLTSASHPLVFPPGTKVEHAIAVQRAFAREQTRVGHQLYKEAANQLREAKFKARGFRSTPSPAGSTQSERDNPIVPPLRNLDQVPQVFISYSWESSDHRKWVLEFASQLQENGISVILDQWHLPHGGDRTMFMERATASDFVLVVCTPEYAEKANKRTGGVGYEAMIITGQIASSIENNKFIPVLRLGDWESALPLWLKTIRGADLRGIPYSASEFQELLRTLHQQPTPAPPIGSRPSFESVVTPRPQEVRLEQFIPRIHISADLNNKERELLGNAVKDKGGQISHMKLVGTEWLQSNGRDFIEHGNPRSRADWLGALTNLEYKGLIEAVGSKKDYFLVTDKGYAMADQLGDFVRWDAEQFTLEARYINAETESVTLPCKGIVEMPPEYYPDNGSGMRSLKERRSLFVEGVNAKALDDLKWTPTDASFMDVKTGKTEQFLVERIETQDTTALRLGIIE